MPTYLLTWSPKSKNFNSSEEDIIELAEDVRYERKMIHRWSTGSRTSIQPGDRVFLLRQGREPWGIIGSGIAIEPAETEADWNAYMFRFDKVYEPLIYPPLDWRNFRGELTKVNWVTPGGGIIIKPAKELEKAWAKHVSQIAQSKEEVDEREYPEGKVAYRMHRERERDPRVVAEAKSLFKKKHRRLFCEVCDFDFQKRFGDIGKDFIEAHHVLHLSKRIKGSTKPSDLALVCSNCHRMFHRVESGTSVEEMKEYLR